MHEVLVDAVFHPWGRVGRSEEAFVVGFVFGEEQFVFSFGVEMVRVELRMRCARHAAPRAVPSRI